MNDPSAQPVADDVIEAVARAICEQEADNPDDWEAFRPLASAFLKQPTVLAAMLSVYRRATANAPVKECVWKLRPEFGDYKTSCDRVDIEPETRGVKAGWVWCHFCGGKIKWVNSDD